MPTTAYRIPDFFSLLPNKPGVGINPHFKEIEIAHNAWFKENLGATRMATQFQRAHAPLVAALAWPLASRQQLTGICDYISAFIFMEVNTDGASSKEAATLAESWIKTLSECTTVEDEEFLHPHFKLMQNDLAPNIKAVIGPRHWARFVDHDKSYAAAVVKEALEREAHMGTQATHDLQSFRALRRDTTGNRPCFTTVLSIQELCIPDDVLNHPVIQDMENAANDMVWIMNDVYSFQKEYREEGALLNLITVLRRHPETHHLDLQARLDYAGKLFREALERFHTAKNNLPTLEQEMRRQLSTYADGMMDFVIGSLEWSAVIPRYGTFMNEEDKKNNIIRLEWTGARL